MPYPKDNLRSVTTQQSSYQHYLHTNTYQPIKSTKFLDEPSEAQPTTPSTVWLSQRHSNNEQSTCLKLGVHYIQVMTDVKVKSSQYDLTSLNRTFFSI